MPSRTRAYNYTRNYLLRSQSSTLLTLTAIFLYTAWLHSSLRSHLHQRKLAHQGFTEHNIGQLAATAAIADSHAAQTTGTGTSRIAGRLVGSQLTHPVKGGTLFSWGLDDSYRLGRTAGDNSAPDITLPQVQVVSVAASRHSLLITTDGQVLSMGPNNSAGGGGHGSQPLELSGQLGRLTGSSAPGPITLATAGGMMVGTLQSNMTAAARNWSGSSVEQGVGEIAAVVVQVVTGRYHSAAVTADGAVYSWGLNDWGQLGWAVPDQEHDGHAELSSRASSGTQPSIATNSTPKRPLEQGSLAQKNSSSLGSCSHGWSCHAATPGRVTALAGHRVVAAAAGRYSTVVLDSDGQLWVWGYDGCATGQVPAQQDAWQPRLIGGLLKGKQVVAFDVGYTFWLAATAEGELYTCDHQDDGYAGTLPQRRMVNHAGQLGRSGGSLTTPGRVNVMPSQKQVIAVAAGRQHAVVATSDGQVFTFGGGRAALGREGPAAEPGRLKGALEDESVVHVAAGEYFSLAATRSRVFAWGSNAFLCLGTGNTSITEALEPATVAGVLGSGDWVIQGVAAGYQHAFVIADKPGDAELAQLRGKSKAAAAAAAADRGASASGADGKAATDAGSSAGRVPGVEVVLTQQQLEARQQQQEVMPIQAAYASSARLHSPTALPQAGAAAGPVADTLNVAGLAPSHDKGSNATGAATNTSVSAASSTRKVEAAAQAAGNLHHISRDISHLSPACAKTTFGNSTRPADWHVSYLVRQLAAAALAPKPPNVSSMWDNWSPSPWHDQLVALSADVFALLPKHFNSMHKNPCWGNSGPELSCLPYFNIIGVSKSGTTDLYHRLTLHKEILPASNKGPHFWDECPYPAQGACTAGPGGDFQAYVNLFSRAADLIRSRPDAITGEASSNTYTSANGVYLRGFKGDKPWTDWAGSAGHNASMPALLREAQPYLRLIAMFRNPVDRYYSAYHYYRWWLEDGTSPTPDDFHSFAAQEVQQWMNCVAAMGTPECVRRYQPQQLVKGMYVEFLQDWLQHFPRQQLLFLRYEDYRSAVPKHLKAVLQFLDMPEPDSSTLSAMTAAEVQNKKLYAPMRSDTRHMLEELYAPSNVALAEALDADCRWLWADVASSSGKAA